MSTYLPEKPRSVKIQVYGSAEARSGEETMTRQSLFSVGRDPKNRSYINIGASIRNLFNKELLVELVKLNRALKIQTSGEPIYLLQIRSQTRSLFQALQHLLFLINTYHYSENVISNVSLVARLVNKYYAIYNTRDDNSIYVWSKEYKKHIEFSRDRKFNLYYMGIRELGMDKHRCPNTVKQALDCTSKVPLTITTRTYTWI